MSKLNLDTYEYKTYSRNVSENINSTKIKTLRQISQTLDLSWVKNKDYRIINTVEAFEECISIMMEKKYIAVDTETTGLNFYNLSHDNPIRDRLVGICLSWEENQGIYIPLYHVKITNLDETFVLSKLKYILENKYIITHNGIFDGKVFYSLGIKLNIKHDTYIMQFNTDSDITHFSLSLKSMTRFVYGYYPIEFEDIFEYEKDYRLFRYIDEDVARIYGCADADHTYSLCFKLLPELNDIHLKGYKKDIEDVVPNIIRSEYCGKSVDTRLLSIMNEINDKDLRMVEELIYSYVGKEICYEQTGTFHREQYKFNISSIPSLSNVIYNLLKYPRSSADNSSLNKTTLRFLLKEKEKQPSPVAIHVMPDDLMSHSKDYPELGYSKKDNTLLKREVFLNTKNRLILLVQLYRTLAKNKSSFFKPLIEGSMEHKYFTSINVARAATFRIIDNFQTLDGRLKKLISPPDGMYMLGYDYAQIEARVMVGLAGDKAMVAELDNPESDYHRLSAAKIEGVRPEQITDAQRKLYKPVNFGLPYGIGPIKMTEDRIGIGVSEEVFKREVERTKAVIAEWKRGMHLVWGMLEDYRDSAMKPLPDDQKPHHWKNKTVGRVTSPSGRSRYVELDNLTESKVASLRRKCGNFPIQCFARDIFVEGFGKLSRVLVKEGLMDIKVEDDYSPLGYHFENKVIFMAYIHDEVQMIIDQSINPKWMMKKVYENCVITIPGHPTYYVGASIINNWYESKAGDHEVPIAWLQNLPENTPKYLPWTPNTQAEIDEECKQYIRNRVLTEFKNIGISLLDDVTITSEKLLEFKSYYLIEKACSMFNYNPSVIDKDKNYGYNAKFIEALKGEFGINITVIVSDNESDSPSNSTISTDEFDERNNETLNEIISIDCGLSNNDDFNYDDFKNIDFSNVDDYLNEKDTLESSDRLFLNNLSIFSKYLTQINKE